MIEKTLAYVTDFTQAARGKVTDCSFAGDGLCGMVTTRVLRWCSENDEETEPTAMVGSDLVNHFLLVATREMSLRSRRAI